MNVKLRFPVKLSAVSALLVIFFLAATLPLASAQTYPRRPVTIVVPWGAGGGTDSVGRILGVLLEKELGQPFNVVNRTGGSGVVGHSAIAYSKPDGYTIGVATVEMVMMHWLGLTQLTYRDITPIGMVNADPAGVMVKAGSKWRTVPQILKYAKSHPGELKASGTGQGGIWHLALAGMLIEFGAKPDDIRWIPSKGAAPGLQDLMADGVDVVTASIPEGRSLIEAKRVLGLAVMGPERLGAFPDIPTLKEATGLNWTNAAWRGIAAPKGTPPEIAAILEQALKKVVQGDQYKAFLAKRGFGWKYMTAAEFGAYMARTDGSTGDVMRAAGIAK